MREKIGAKVVYWAHADFEGRGGDFRAGQPISPEEIAALSGVHDLVVVASGKGGTSAMFPVIPGKSPYGRPMRRLQLLGAMSQNPAVADEFTDNFNRPERQWDILATPERTAAFLARHGM